ncbi:AAA-type ATPase, N-terminal domain [Dillenia turbinata]|uniref:AAA-type ATPase, N-terminal domain n=1 Tax=Dillenia turbinata TaxID=194707 RepID=A0AAN8VVP0_9MAGN
MFVINVIVLILLITFIVLFKRILSKTSLLYVVKKWWRVFEDRCHVYQSFKIPEHNDLYQENQLYRKVQTYLSSLTSVEDSDYANLFSGNKSNEIQVHFDQNDAVLDTFLSARVYWKNEKSEKNQSRVFVLKVRRKDKRRILRPYLQHIHTISDEIEQRRKELRLYVNSEAEIGLANRWISMPFTHPASFDTIVMDSDLKSKVKTDLENFLKSKQYYHKLGRVWKRSYLLYGPSGTGKSSFVSAMAKFLSYDVYNIDLNRVADDSDPKLLLLQTKPKALIVIEDLDRFLVGKSTSAPTISLSGILNFMDGIFSGVGEERIMIFTMNTKEQIDPQILRPGRIDFHLHFPLCDFPRFKTLANSHLGLKVHKLFPQVEEIFQTGASLSPAEIGEIMISNRSSPSRALRTVITALQSNKQNGASLGLTHSSSGRGEEVGEPGGVICRESVHTVREFRKLYGLLRRSRRQEGSMDLGSTEKEN